MRSTTKIATLLCTVLLIGCVGPFESKTCGIKNTQWDQLSSFEQIDLQKAYNEKQRLADQLKLMSLL